MTLHNLPQQQAQKHAQQPQRADYAAGGAPREHEQNDIFRLLDNNNNNNDRVNNFANNNGYEANYMNVMYDEDDEMLARAIQESLNDGLY